MEHLTWAFTAGTAIGALLGVCVTVLVARLWGVCGTLKTCRPVTTPKMPKGWYGPFEGSVSLRYVRIPGGQEPGSRSSRTSSSRRFAGRSRSRSK